MAKKNNNPYVTATSCAGYRGEMNMKLNQILHILNGNPNNRNDLGMRGDVQKLNRNWKITIGTLMAIGVPLFLWAITTFIFGGG